MKCGCFCSEDESVKKSKISSKSRDDQDKIKSESFENQLFEGDFDAYVSKKIFHDMPTIREEDEDDDTYKSRRQSKFFEIKKKQPLVAAQTEKFYEFLDRLNCFFCGDCGCDENKLETQDQAIPGLNSDLICDNIYISQRPSQKNFNENQLLSVFREKNIGLVVNLLRKGEHKYCGNKIIPEIGHSYDPRIFIPLGIKYQNYNWNDNDITNAILLVLQIVKDILSITVEEKKKVFLHCHNGYGRSGIVVACYLIKNTDHSVEDIIKIIKNIRPKCFGQQTQIDFCQKFKNFIDGARLLYRPNVQTLDFYLSYQFNLLFGKEIFELRNVPKLIKVLIFAIIHLKNKNKITLGKMYQDLFFLDFWDEDLENKICEYKLEINRWNWSVIENCKEATILIQLLFDWIEDSVDNLVPPNKIISVFQRINEMEIKNRINDFSRIKPVEHHQMIAKLYDCFSISEFECLIHISCLISQIFPEKGLEKPHFKRVLEKFTLLVCGINPRKVGYHFTDKTLDSASNKIPAHIERLFSVFNTLMTYLSYYSLYELKLEPWKFYDLNTFVPNPKYSSASPHVKPRHSILNNIVKINNSPNLNSFPGMMKFNPSIARKSVFGVEDDKKYYENKLFDFKNSPFNSAEITKFLKQTYNSLIKNNKSIKSLDEEIRISEDFIESNFTENEINEILSSFNEYLAEQKIGETMTKSNKYSRSSVLDVFAGETINKLKLNHVLSVIDEDNQHERVNTKIDKDEESRSQNKLSVNENHSVHRIIAFKNPEIIPVSQAKKNQWAQFNNSSGELNRKNNLNPPQFGYKFMKNPTKLIFMKNSNFFKS